MGFKPRTRRKRTIHEEQPPKLINFGGCSSVGTYSSGFLIWKQPNKKPPPGVFFRLKVVRMDVCLFKIDPATCVRDSRMCVLLCFIKPMLGNRYGPGVSSCQQISDNLGCVLLCFITARPYESCKNIHSKMPLRSWYNCGTNHFHQADFCLAEMKKPTMLSNKRSTA